MREYHHKCQYYTSRYYLRKELISFSLQPMDGGSQQSQLDIRFRQYQALIQAAESIAAHRNLKSLLEVLTERLQVVVEFDAVQILLYDPEQNLMRRHVLESVTPPRDHTELTIAAAKRRPVREGNRLGRPDRVPSFADGSSIPMRPTATRFAVAVDRDDGLGRWCTRGLLRENAQDRDHHTHA